MLQWKNPRLVALLVALATVATAFGQWGWLARQWGW
jgi:hypothetical protein